MKKHTKNGPKIHRDENFENRLRYVSKLVQRGPGTKIWWGWQTGPKLIIGGPRGLGIKEYDAWWLRKLWTNTSFWELLMKKHTKNAHKIHKDENFENRASLCFKLVQSGPGAKIWTGWQIGRKLINRDPRVLGIKEYDAWWLRKLWTNT